MLNTNIIPARNLQKAYKAIIENVKSNKQPVVLTTNDGPQAVIIPLEDLEKLEAAKAAKAALDMLKLASDNREELKSLPANLRDLANRILYTNAK
ncbi:MAG: type II toxin-antitoxin system Phd/YefM family antitoxin [Patescibacteria group bacterium]|nr:type II toxin-antitoxin system Phd/YefM family antitoxin [Patescibacteria group bacterium]